MKKRLITALLVCLTLPKSSFASHGTFTQIESLITLGNYKKALEVLAPLAESEDFAISYEAQVKQAVIFRKQGKFERALSTLNYVESNHYLPLPRYYHLHKEKGINYRRLSQLDAAEKHYNLALDAAIKMDDKDKLAQSYSNLGTLFDHRSMVGRSMQYQLKAQKLLADSNDWELVGSNLYNLGDLAARLKDFTQAKFFFEQALEADKKSGELINIGDTSLRIAEMVIQAKEYDSGIQLVNEAISHLSKIPSHALLSRAKNNLTKVHLKRAELESALLSAKQSLFHASQTESVITQTYANLYLGEVYLKLNQLNQLEKVLSTLKGLTQSRKNNFLKEKYLTLLSRANKAKGELDEAFIALEEAYKLNETLMNKTINDKSLMHKKSLDFLMQQQQLMDSEKEKMLTKNQLENAQHLQQVWLFTVVILILLSALFAYIYYNKHRNTQLRAKLYERNLEQKDKLLADISHELRTPLSVLRLHIEALEHNLIDDKDLAYGKINEKISQLNNLISDVYQLSLAESDCLSMHCQRYCANTLVSNYEYDIKRLVESHQLDFIHDIRLEQDVSICIDKQKLDRIVDNLAKNACLYTDSPGKVRFKVRANNKTMLLQIDDTTPGVSEKEIPKLFERLYRVESSRCRATGGSGLGLAICKTLVEAMSGTITIKPGKLGGVCVQLQLPIAK